MLFYLKKKSLNINVFLTSKKIFLSFDFTKSRRRYLKNKRRFFCTMHTGKLTLSDTMTSLETWLNSVNEDALLEQLEDAPEKYRPVMEITRGVFLDFNIEEEDVLGKLFPF